MQCTGNSGCFPRGKRAATVRRPTQVLFLCAVFSCFRNPPNFYMDYRIFNVRTVRDHSYACVHTRGLSTPKTSQHNIFDSELKSHFVFLCSGRDSNLWSLDFESMLFLYPLSHPVTPVYLAKTLSLDVDPVIGHFRLSFAHLT